MNSFRISRLEVSVFNSSSEKPLPRNLTQSPDYLIDAFKYLSQVLQVSVGS